MIPDYLKSCNTPFLVPQKCPLKLVKQSLERLILEEAVDLLKLFDLNCAISKLLTKMLADSK